MTQEDAHLDPAVFVTTPGEDLTEPACLPACPDRLQSALQHRASSEHGAQGTAAAAADIGLFMCKLIVMLFRDGINLVQFHGTLSISVVGTRIEDKFLLLDQR